MITVLAIMTAGIFLGWLLHHKKQFLKIVSHTTNWAIYALLFLLGVSVGTNEKILNNFDKIGVQSIVITLFAVAGSILVSWLTYILFFKNNEG
ncbi:MAG: lysine exporter LysO family protein [Bacteroidetes bacterium]|nr:lysine exporter LysO family protein [Bacteroidota bacterium]